MRPGLPVSADNACHKKCKCEMKCEASHLLIHCAVLGKRGPELSDERYVSYSAQGPYHK